MFAVLLIYFFLLGIIIGSFLNVVILRHNTGKTIKGRSMCMSCKTTLTSKDLVPVLSFLLQRGKCRYCKSKISWQYASVELATGVLFAANFLYLYLNSSSLIEMAVTFVLTLTILALMMVIFVYDIKHKIIPDKFSFAAFGFSVVYMLSVSFLFKNNSFWIEGGNVVLILNICAGLIFYFVIYSIWKLSKGRLIGLGDAKLLLSIGTVLGIVYGLSAIFLSFWLGLAYAIFLMLKERLSIASMRTTMKKEIAFGPFLIIAFLIVYFFKIDVTNLGFILENFS